MNCLKRVLSVALMTVLLAVNFMIPAMAEAADITVSYTDLLSNTLPGGNGTLFFDTSAGSEQAGTGLDNPPTNYNRAYAPLEVWSMAARASLNMKASEWVRFEVEATTAGYYSVDLNYACGAPGGADFIIRTDRTILEPHLARTSTAYAFITAGGLGYVYLKEGTNYIYVDNKSASAQVNFKSFTLTLDNTADARDVTLISYATDATEAGSFTPEISTSTEGYKVITVADNDLTFTVPVAADGKYKVSIRGAATGDNEASVDFGGDAKTAAVSSTSYEDTELGVFALTADTYTLTLTGLENYKLAWVALDYVAPYQTAEVSTSIPDNEVVARGTDNFVITFNDVMDDQAASTATLTAPGAEIATEIDIVDETVTVSFLETLDFDTTYTLTLSGFQGASDTEALADIIHTFSTDVAGNDSGTETITAIEVSAVHEAVTVTGNILGTTGKGIKGRTVSIADPDSNEVATATTGDNGFFTLNFVIPAGTDVGVYNYTVTSEYGDTETAVVSYVSEQEEFRILDLFTSSTEVSQVEEIFVDYEEILGISEYATDVADLANTDLFHAHFIGKTFDNLSDFLLYYNKMLRLEQMNQATDVSYVYSEFFSKPEVWSLLFDERTAVKLSVISSTDRYELATQYAQIVSASGPCITAQDFYQRVTALIDDYYGIGEVSIVGETQFNTLPTDMGANPVLIPVTLDRELKGVTGVTFTLTASDPAIFSQMFYTTTPYTIENSTDYKEFEYINWSGDGPVRQKLSIKGRNATIQTDSLGCFVINPLVAKEYSLTIAGIVTHKFNDIYTETSTVLPQKFTLDTREVSGYFEVDNYYSPYCKINWKMCADGTLYVENATPDHICQLGSESGYSSLSIPYKTYKSGTKKIVFKDVTLVGQSELEYYNNLKEVVFESPAGMALTLGRYAFSGCYSLQTVYLPENMDSIGDGAFQGCFKLQTIRMPEKLTEIGRWAFQSCYELNDIQLPKGLISIGDSAFSSCRALKSLALPDTVTSIGENAFQYCYALDEIHLSAQLATISRSAFLGCSSLKEIIIPEGVISIGGDAFNGCTTLEKITLPDTLETIEGHAFHACEALTEFVIPDSVKTIEHIVFCECTGLERVVIGSGVTSMGVEIFIGCNNLKTVVIKEGITSLNGLSYTAIPQISIPNTVTNIRNGTFKDSNRLTSIVIPDSVTEMGDFVFIRCSSLENVKLGDGITIIPQKTFADCVSLKEIEIPENVEMISYSAFAGCESLKTVSLSKNTTVIADDAFLDCNSLTDVYYDGTEEEWNEIFIGEHNEALTGATIHFVTRLTYSANGGENAPETVNTEGEVEISAQVPTRFGYVFKGWALNPTDWNPGYQPGDTISLSEGSVTLYAVWEAIDMNAMLFDEGLVVSVSNAPEGSQVMVACYAGDVLKTVKGITVTTEKQYQIPGDFTGIDRMRVMLYDSLDSLKPLANAVDVTK